MAKKRSPRKISPPADSTAQEIPIQIEDENGADIPDELPVLPLRGTVVFPGTVMPLHVGRAKSQRLLDESLSKSKYITVVAQRDEASEDPTPEQLYDVGTAVMVLKLIRQPDETVSIIVHGMERVRLNKFTQQDPFLRAAIKRPREKQGKGKSFVAAIRQLREQARELIELTPDAPEQAMTVLMNIEEPGGIADFLGANLTLELQQRQDLLEEFDVPKRVRAVHYHLSSQLEIARLQQKIQMDVQSSIDETQHKFYLREQLKAIQKELGEGGDGAEQTVVDLRRKIEEAGPPEKVMTEATRELGRLESIPSASPEYSMLLSYLELIAELPWSKSSPDNLDLDRARTVLDRDHYDLEKVKRRLIEFLAVRKLNPKGQGPILCLLGPPGVGKTSLGQSIADALGRQFVRMSLGGIRDEAEIRGHRRTYIGSMPGRIIQELRRAGTNNPVMMLDEVDKLGRDFRGDPSSALLEVLDPRQNNAFVDRYLDVPFDLSQVIFIATANYMGGVPAALRDRMEVIEIPGYTDNEKLQIARKYLIPRQIKENGLNQRLCRWTNAGVRKTINDYTREAGVRTLERRIGAVCRAIAAKVATHENGRKAPGTKVQGDVVREHLGPERYTRDLDTRTEMHGVAIGLAYTSVGGEILFVEAAGYPGKGNVTLTGQIGNVMKESATAAMSLFKSRAPEFHYDISLLSKHDVHIHVPAGAVPKDGPSAGVAMLTAITSLLLDIPTKPRVAMTGEVTLRGLVLPVGGIKEKTLAAHRAGIKTVLLPEENQRDLEEIDPEVRKKLDFVFVKTVDEVLEQALGKDALAKVIEENKRRAAAKRKKESQANDQKEAAAASKA